MTLPFNPMAIFRRTNTPMSGNAHDRRIQERAGREEHNQELMSRVIREYEDRMLYERANDARARRTTYQNLADSVSPNADVLTRARLNEFIRAMEGHNTPTGRRRTGNSGGYDLVHKE